MTHALTDPDLFIDGLLDISFARGIVRVDLYSLSAVEKTPQGLPKSEFRRRLVMSTDGFLEFVNGLMMGVQFLRDRGVVTTKLPEHIAARLDGAQPPQPASAPPVLDDAEPEEEPEAPPISASIPAPSVPKSPNFPDP